MQAKESIRNQPPVVSWKGSATWLVRGFLCAGRMAAKALREKAL